MSILKEALTTVRLGETQRHRNLTLTPLLGEGPERPEYRLLDESLALGCARVTEVSASGSVPELKFVNDCDRPVLLLDGEELVGAKQNRILNLTVLVPAKSTLAIPVSCVEAGRWRAESADFAAVNRTHYAAGRARKAAQVSESLYSSGTRHSDQGAVWEDIAAKSARMQASSDTAAAAAMYEKHRADLNGYRQAFAAVEGQVGTLFAINGENLGLDLFDSPATLAALLGKLVESYALDALDTRPATPERTEEDPKAFLDEAANAATETFPAIGEGEDLRLRDERLAGGALVKDGHLIHLCVFRLPPDVDPHRRRGSRLSRPSRRRPRWVVE